MRIPEDLLRKRIKKFQDKFREQGLDGVMLRTLSSYSYFTGIKWLRPGLFIPSEGEPIAFISRGEEQGFVERTWIKNVITYKDGGDLIG
ncbi:MAG: aminopeptidase P family N-terminal domain-containing protein, partial [Candidatus Njordarchaeales archaeon]